MPYILDASSTGEAVDFGPSTLSAAASIADPMTHLTVVRQGRNVGFRSDVAGGKMLQARKRGASKLCFFNVNFGINEQWETMDEPKRRSGDDEWVSTTMRLRNRRLPLFVLTVEVMRVPPEMREGGGGGGEAAAWRGQDLTKTPGGMGRGGVPDSPDTHQVNVSTTPSDVSAVSDDDDDDEGGVSSNPVMKMVAYHEKTIAKETKENMSRSGSRSSLDQSAKSQSQPQLQPRPQPHQRLMTPGGPDSPAPGSSVGTPPGRPPPGHKRDVSGEEQGNALRSMSGVLIKEWSAFVLKEVRARKEVERQMLALREEMQSMGSHIRMEMQVNRQEWIGDAAFYGSQVRKVYEEQAALRDKVVIFARRTFARRQLMSVMARWGAYTLKSKIKRVAFRRGMARMIRVRESAPFHTWRQNAINQAHLRRMLVRVSANNYRRVGVTTIRAWHNCIKVMKARRADARAMQMRRANRAGRRALTSWRLNARRGREKHVMKCIMSRAANKLYRRTLSAAFDGWLVKTEKRRRLREIAVTAVTRRARLCVESSFYPWRHLSRVKRRRRKGLSALVLRLLGRQLSASFTQWKLETKRRRARERVVRVIAMRVSRGCLRNAFTLWASTSRSMQTKRNRVHDFNRYIVAKMTSATTAKAFSSWRTATLVKRESVKKACVFVRRTLNRIVAAAFTGWATHTVTMLAARDNAVLFTVRVMRFAAHKAFQRWHEASRDLRSRRVAITVMIRRWSETTLRSALRGWSERVKTVRVQRARVSSLIWRMQYRYGTVAFNAWYATTQRQQRVRELATKVRAPIAHRALNAAFKGWSHSVASHKERVARARRIVVRMRRVRESSTLAAWRFAVDAMTKNRAAARRVAVRMTRVKLYSALNAWIDATTVSRITLARNARVHRWQSRYARAQTVACLDAWHKEAERSASFRRRANRALSRIRLSVVSRAMNCWTEKVQDSKRHGRLMEKSATFFMNNSVRAVLLTWRRNAIEIRRQRVLLRVAMRQLGASETRRCLKVWQERTRRRREESRGARRALMCWRRGRLGATWRRWMSQVQSSRVARHLGEQISKVRSAAGDRDVKRRAWIAWTRYVDEYRRMSNLMAKAYANQQRLWKQSAWNSWIGFLERMEARRDTVSRNVTSKRTVMKWFLDWYWQAFEGDINSAISLITGNCDDVIGEVYGEDRRGTKENGPGVFQQWQMLGGALEAFAAPVGRAVAGGETESAVKQVASKWQQQTQQQHHRSMMMMTTTQGSVSDGGGDDESGGGSPRTPYTPFTPGVRGGGDASFASASDETFSSPAGGTTGGGGGGGGGGGRGGRGGRRLRLEETPGGGEFIPFSGGLRLDDDDVSVDGSAGGGGGDTPMSEARRAWTSAVKLMDDHEVE